MKQFLICFLVLLGMIVNGLSMDSSTTITESFHMGEVTTEEHLSINDGDGQDVPDIFGTSPETKFRFMFNGRVLGPGESILVCTAAPGQECRDTDEEQE